MLPQTSSTGKALPPQIRRWTRVGTSRPEHSSNSYTDHHNPLEPYASPGSECERRNPHRALALAGLFSWRMDGPQNTNLKSSLWSNAARYRRAKKKSKRKKTQRLSSDFQPPPDLRRIGAWKLGPSDGKGTSRSGVGGIGGL